MSGDSAACSHRVWLAVVMKNATGWTRLVTRRKKPQKPRLLLVTFSPPITRNHLRQRLLNATGVTRLVRPLAKRFEK